MKFKVFKKSVALLFAFLLVFSNLSYAAPATKVKNLDPENDNTTLTLEESVELNTEKQYKPDDIVRVVVELAGQPAISYAQEQGKRYKDLDENVQENIQSNILTEQEKAQKTIADQGITFEIEHSFTTVVNGFSGEVTFREATLIEKLPGVEKVHISNEYELPEEQEPDMKYSHEIIKSIQAWQDFGYDGEGMIVGIIDTGIDPWHADMALSEGTEYSLTKEFVNEMRETQGIPGVWFTEKVPYGYNYMDKNTQILETGPSISSHGMHVAGTVAANGEIFGVAPEAQLLALKVFGNDPRYGSTYGDIYVKAIDDAIILGADVVNLSLGSTAAFVRPEDPEQQAIARAIENGLVAAISAGNSAYYGFNNGGGLPLATNPDIGLTGAPSLSHDSISVASFENAFIEMEGLSWVAGDESGEAAFLASNEFHKNVNGPVEVVHVPYTGAGDAGLASLKENLAKTDVAGKFVLVSRGLTFVDKTKAIQDAGAAGAIVYNHSSGYINMATDASIVIPQLFISKTDGDALVAFLKDGETVTVEFGGDSVVAPNPDFGKFSSFTSWGTPPNLDFKPELSAPGGNILSTIQGGDYGLKSGTSMAAPHVAGGSALVLQRVDEEFGLEGADRALMAKNILLNTSTTVIDKELYNNAYQLGNPYSPRKQGAGLMDLYAAMSTPVVVTDSTTGEAKASLKEVGDVFSFTLKAENFSDEAVTYQVAGNVQTDLVLSGRNRVESQGVFKAGTISDAQPWLGEYPIEFSHVDENGQLTVPANGSVEFTVTVDLTDAVDWAINAPLKEIFKNGTFIEGFVTLTDINDSKPALSLPYVSFYGDWDQAPIVDTKRYETTNRFLTWTGLVNEKGSFLNPIADLNGEKNVLAFSPNGNGMHDGVNPVLTFLRNAKDVEFNILDAKENKLRTVKLEKDVRKSHGTSGAAPYSYVPDRLWDGTVKGNVVQDGLYYYEVKSRVDFEDAKWQTMKFPVYVDTKAPEVDVTYDFDKAVIEWKVTEVGSGLVEVQFMVNGELISTVPASEELFKKEGTFDVTGIAKGATVEVVALDRAGNSSVETVKGINDGNVPYIFIDSPNTLTAFPTFEVPVSGHILDSSQVKMFKVNGVETPVTWNEVEKRFDFSTTVTFEQDGSHDIFFEATDSRGNDVSIKRQILVDTTSPVLEVHAPKNVAPSTEEVTLHVSMEDNFNQLNLYVDGSQVYTHPLRAPYESSDFEDMVELTLPVALGTNTFTLKLVDVAGNETVEVLTINRKEAVVDRLSGEDRYETAVELSKEGWTSSDVVVIARGDHFADALAGVPLAKKHDAPLLLTRTKALPQVTMDEITRLGAKTVYILGGTNVVEASIEKALDASGITVKRIAGEDRWETAAKIAHEVAPNGAEGVVVVNGRNFPDALSVASYAAEYGMPILLTDQNKLPSKTKAALDALDPSETIVIGGTDVVSESVFKSLTNGERIGGKNRYETAVKVSEYFNGGLEHYYVATGQQFADALGGAALAAKEGTGILLVAPNKLPQEVEKFVTDHGVGTLTVIGGQYAVSEDVFNKLTALLK